MTNFKLTAADRETVLKYLELIGEKNQDEIKQVLQNCRDDPEHTINQFLPLCKDYIFYNSL